MSPLRLCLLGALLAALPMLAAKPAADAPDDPWQGWDETLYMDMDLEQNLLTPEPAPSDLQPLRRHMRKLATELAVKKYQVELDRDDEVVVVTIPLERLFSPNDTLLSSRAPDQLKPLLNYLRQPAMYKLVYAVHSDNTGSESYNYALSQERVNSLYDWLLDHVNEDLIIIPFAMGDTEPLADNATRTGRRANRRLELFLVPGPELITKARKGQLGK